MSLDSKPLRPAQEAEITRKLAYVAGLDQPTFVRLALKSPAFRRWFKAVYGIDPGLFPEKITPDMRAPFLAAWEQEWRSEIELAEINARIEAAEHDDGEDIGADLPMVRPRAYDRHGEDERGEGDGGDNDDDDADPASASNGAPVPEFPPLNPPEPGAPFVLPDGRMWVNGVHFPSPAAYAAHLAQDKIAEAELAAYEAKSASEFEGTTVADDDAPDPLPDYLIDKMVYRGPSLTFAWGLPDAGKSMQFQKASVVVGSESANFEGHPTLHGPVLFISLDLGARRGRVKFRMRLIADKLGIPYSDRVVIVHDVVNLLDPHSIKRLLAKHPGPWAMIVIDPLNKCVGGGDLSQPTTMLPALEGAKNLAIETSSAVVIVTHSDKKDTDIYGVVFQSADADIILHMQRHYQKDGQSRNGDRVTMTWGRDKNGSPPDKPAEYIIDEAYLAPVGGKAPGIIEHREWIKELPTEWRPVKGSLDLVADLMPAKLSKGKGGGRETLWYRLREQWEAAGLIEQKDGNIRRVTP